MKEPLATVLTEEPEPLWQVNGAASVLAKQSLAFEQHPTTVVDVPVDAYDGVHVAGENAYVFAGVPVAVAAA
jgi:hypothetical protein